VGGAGTGRFNPQDGMTSGNVGGRGSVCWVRKQETKGTHKDSSPRTGAKAKLTPQKEKRRGETKANE